MSEQRQEAEGYWALLEPHWDSVSIYGTPDEFLAGFVRLRPAVGHLFAAHWWYSEWCNGGLDQFFANPTGVLAPEAIDGLRVIGLRECADVLAQAVGMFGVPYPRDASLRAVLLAAMTSRAPEGGPLGPLDRVLDELLFPGDAPRFDDAANEYARRVAG